MSGHEPAKTLWDLVELDLGPLDPGDPRLVDTSEVRGHFSRDRILDESPRR